MMKVANKVEPISTVDTKSKTNCLDQFKEITSRPERQINQKNSPPIADRVNEASEDATLQMFFP